MSLLFSSRRTDNSTRITNTTDSFNATSSWSQGISDVGNTSVQVNPPGGQLQQLVPVILVGLVVLGVLGLGRSR